LLAAVAAHGHEAHGEEHGHEDVVVTEEFGREVMASTIGQMLIGSVVFFMSLFYAVNHHDADMRRYTWIVMGTTISIFSSVLLFQGVRGVLADKVFVYLDHELVIVADFVHMLLWFATMQAFVLFVVMKQPHKAAVQPYEALNVQTPAPAAAAPSAGAAVSSTSPGLDRKLTRRNSDPAVASREASDSLSAPLVSAFRSSPHRLPKGEAIEAIRRDAKSLGGLIAHITAFAAIHAFGHLQDMLYEEFGLLGAVAAALVAALAIAICCLIAGRVRDYVIGEEVDEAEELWEEIVEEIENDVFALAFSHLIAEVCRFIVEPEHVHFHSTAQMSAMVGCALVFLGGLGLVGANHHALEKATSPRIVETAQLTCSFTFAFNLLTWATWTIGHIAYTKGWTHIWMEVVEALAVSLASFAGIRVLDWLADQDWTGEATDKCIRDTVLAIGMLIGFCWEHCFDLGVESIAEAQGKHPVAKLVGCVLITVVVIPAYRLYIVPTVFTLSDDKDAVFADEAKSSGAPRPQKVHAKPRRDANASPRHANVTELTAGPK
jgi:hypothetical protein